MRLTGIWWACMTVSLATPAYNACSGSSAAMVHKWEKKGKKVVRIEYAPGNARRAVLEKTALPRSTGSLEELGGSAGKGRLDEILPSQLVGKGRRELDIIT